MYQPNEKPTDSASLVIEKLGFSYGDHAVLQDVSFTVAPAELVCLVGPSGCGKSTLLRLIAGLSPLQSGRIAMGDTALAQEGLHLPPQERRIGMVFQQPSLFPHLTLRDNIGFGLTHLKPAARAAIIDHYLKLTGLDRHGGHFPHMLSGGQQQRAALARSLAPAPRAMLLDEPFANLDDQLRREIRGDVIEILKKAGVPVILVTHDPEEALLLADRIVLLSDEGRIHQIASPDTLHQRPTDPQAAAFFGPVNQLKGDIASGMVTTPIGEIQAEEYPPALAFEDGPVTVVARPEGLRITQAGDDTANATVRDCRYTASGWMVTARLDSGENLRILCPGGPKHLQGGRIRVALYPAQVFIFAGVGKLQD